MAPKKRGPTFIGKNHRNKQNIKPPPPPPVFPTPKWGPIVKKFDQVSNVSEIENEQPIEEKNTENILIHKFREKIPLTWLKTYFEQILYIRNIICEKYSLFLEKNDFENDEKINYINSKSFFNELCYFLYKNNRYISSNIEELDSELEEQFYELIL